MKKAKHNKSIMYIAPSYLPRIGGAEISLHKIYEGVKKQNKTFIPKILTINTDKKGNVLETENISDKNVFRYSPLMYIPFENAVKRWDTVVRVLHRKLNEQINTEGTDLIYFNNPILLKNKHIVKRITALAPNTPIIIKIPETDLLRYMQNNESLKKSSNVYVHCLSKEIKSEIIRYGYNRSNIFFCPNPIDTKLFKLKTKKHKKHLINKYQISETDTILVYTGRFSEQKNIPGIVEIYRNLKKQRDDIKLFMIGYCQYPNMRNTINELKKLAPDVFWLDIMSNSEISEFLRGSDIFIMASRFEGMSNSLLEAMSSGLCPIIPSNISGARELIEHSRNGLLFNTKNITKLCNTLSHLTNEEISDMGLRAREKVKSYCDTNIVIQHHLNFYSKLINREIK